MDRVKIKRVHDRKDCTLSVIVFRSLIFNMLELPWLDNQKNVSCIPTGSYWAFKRFSPSKQCWVIEYENVPNRTYIQIHAGNYTRDILGCQLAGDKFIDIDGDGIPDITRTKATLQKLLNALPERFMIDIT